MDAWESGEEDIKFMTDSRTHVESCCGCHSVISIA